MEGLEQVQRSRDTGVHGWLTGFKSVAMALGAHGADKWMEAEEENSSTAAETGHH